LGKELGAGTLGSLVTAALGGSSALDASKSSRSKSKRREHRHRDSRDDRDRYEGKVSYGGGDYDADRKMDNGGRDRRSKDYDGGKDRKSHRSSGHRRDYYDSEGYDSD
jgi:hypothetical protein